MTDNAAVIAALQCDYYHYAICYIGSVAVVVPLWLKHRFCVAVLPCKRGNSSVIYTITEFFSEKYYAYIVYYTLLQLNQQIIYDTIKTTCLPRNS